MDETSSLTTGHFEFNIEGFKSTLCTSVSPIHLHIERIELAEGPSKQTIYRKGHSRVSEFTVTCPFNDKDFFKWFQECQQGAVKKRNGSVIFQNAENTEVYRLNLFGIWPMGWTTPSLSRDFNSAIICEETILFSADSAELI